MCDSCDLDGMFRKSDAVPNKTTYVCSCLKGYYDDGKSQKCQ